jgi:DNA polymerase-3 subunit gamma/tau
MGVTASAPTTAADWNEDEVAIASQRLADFFKGEVVKFNSESTFPDSTDTNSPPLIATSVAQTWDDADLAVGEAELDF